MTLLKSAGASSGYRLVERLGEGASGVVYKALQESTGQDVAVKVLRQQPDAATDAAAERQAARFAREMRLCAQLHHPGIVRLLDQGRSAAGELFAVFEFVPGETLRDLLARERALPAPQACALMGQVLDALAEAHAQGIVHRDLKPMNIMVTQRGERLHAKVLDFGIGTLAAGPGLANPRDMTLEGEMLGTPRYSAPEQLRGEPPTVRSDLYAWGLILLECLTGEPAVRAASLAEVYHRHLSPEELPLPPALLRHPLGALLRQVLSKQARDRGGDTAELHARFLQISVQGLVGLSSALPAAAPGQEATRASPAGAERRQVTMLCFSLELAAADGGAGAELDAMEELLRAQLLLCQDTCVALGGTLAGALGGTRLVYFGYPQASDAAVRQAAQAALELVAQGSRRSLALQASEGVRLDLRVALHTGMMLAWPGQVPAGLAALAAERLVRVAAPATIVVSDMARRLLQRHFVLDAAAADDGGARLWHLQAERDALPDAGEDASLAGRHEELARLLALWQQVAAGSDAALALVGEPGIGKSHLVRVLCQRVREEQGTAWVLQCAPEHRHSALQPFLRWVAQQLRLDAAGPGLAGQRLHEEMQRLGAGSAETAAILASWMGLPLPAALPPVLHGPQRQRELVMEALAAVLRASAAGPALLVLEDAHWADPTSRDFIDWLLARPPAQRAALGLVLTARPGFAGPAAVPQSTLQRLDGAACEALLRGLPGAQALDAQHMAHLVARSDGNPLFLIELARARLDLAPEPELPPSLRDVLGLALDRLGPARHTAQVAAAIGREFDPALLLRATLRDPASVQSDLDQMLLAELVTRQRQVQGETYMFRHALIRDAAYDSMAQPARVAAHERVAIALDAAGNSAPAVLARHYALARRFEAATQQGLRGAGEALARASHEEALGQADAVRGWLQSLAPDARTAAELDLSLLVTQALMSKVGWADPRVREQAEQSRQLLDTLEQGRSEHARRAAALWALATFHHVASDRERVRALGRQIEALALEEEPPVAALQRAAASLQGIGAWIDGDYAAAAAALRQVGELPRADGAEDAARFGLDCRCWSLAALANVLWFHEGDPQPALALAQHAVDEAQALAHMPTLGLALMYQAFLHQHANDRAAAGAVSGRLLELSGRYGLPAVAAYAAAVHAWSQDDGERLRAILGSLQGMGCQLGQTYLCALAADVAERNGDAALSLSTLEQGLLLAERSGEHYYVPELLRLKAAWLARRGANAAAVRELVSRAAESARRQAMASTAQALARMEPRNATPEGGSP